MFTLTLWLIIFVLGLALYFSPLFFVRPMYEGFNDNDKYLKQLHEMLQPQVAGTPDLGSPEGATVSKSEPSQPNLPDNESSVLEQGKAFQQSTPSLPIKKDQHKHHEHHKNIIATAPSDVQGKMFLQSPVTQIRYIEKPCPRRKCPPPPPPKQCPDMRDFIRKDSIPCWSCKLG